ncbi:MAG: oligosaccharide flippase family protein [Lachnospiraceae bacterium]|nr:oligosaccharide flippase family protein [Lachnospiraceae bacterium]
METKKLSIKQNMLYNSVGFIVYLFCQWLITIVVVRLSNYEDAGILSLAMSINNILYAISTFGLRNYQVSDIENKYSDYEYIIVRGVTCCFSTICCFIFLLLNSTHYSMNQMGCILLYFIFKVTEALIDVIQGIQQKKYRMDYVGKSFVIRGILTLSGFTIVFKVTSSLAASIAAMILLSASVAFFYDYVNCKKLTKLPSELEWSKVKAVIMENMPLMFNELFMTGVVSVARYFLEFYEGNEVLGIYASIATPTVIIQAACNMIYSPLISEYAVHYNKKDYKAYKKLIVGVLEAFVLILALVLAGVFVLGDWGLQLLFGSEILEYSYLLSQTVLVTFLVAFMYWLSALMVVARKQKSVMLINGAAIILVIIFSVQMIPQMGINGINYALFATFAVDIVLLAVLAFRTVRENFAADTSK